MQERRNSIANALELRLSYTNPSMLHMIETNKLNWLLLYERDCCCYPRYHTVVWLIQVAEKYPSISFVGDRFNTVVYLISGIAMVGKKSLIDMPLCTIILQCY